MGFEDPKSTIEQRLRESKITDAIFDSLFICDIENDKIDPKLRPELNDLVARLATDHPPDLAHSSPLPSKKLSITQEDIDTLHQTILDDMANRLRHLGMSGFEGEQTFQELSKLIKGIIQNEKGHRSAE